MPLPAETASTSRCSASDEGAGLEVAGRHLGDDEAGLGEVLGGGGLDDPEPLADGVEVTALEGRLRRPGQGDHGGEALGEGVVDLARHPLALRRDARGPLGGGQLGLRAARSSSIVAGPAVGLDDEPVDEQAEREREHEHDDAWR